MGLYTPKSYKKLNRKTGKWDLVKPKPVEFRKEISRGGKLRTVKSEEMDHLK